jgi:D-alanyl-D-alanine carboxypeptidase
MAPTPRDLLLALASVLLVVPSGALLVTAGSPGGDDERPTITGLDPALAAAVRRATADAAEDGIELRITSGRRSRAYQQRLLDDAIDSYGEAEARRRVATPDRSRHVTGDAVDVGPTDAAYWLAEHGPAYGLCQVYANEIWHYELLATPGGECPPMRPDSSSP